MLDEDRHEALERAQDGAMENHRTLPRSVLGGVVQIEPLRLEEVGLDRRALMGAPDGVLDLKVDLGSVESAVAGVDLVAGRGLRKCGHQCRFRLLPLLVGSDGALWPRRQIDPEALESEV